MFQYLSDMWMCMCVSACVCGCMCVCVCHLEFLLRGVVVVQLVGFRGGRARRTRLAAHTYHIQTATILITIDEKNLSLRVRRTLNQMYIKCCTHSLAVTMKHRMTISWQFNVNDQIVSKGKCWRLFKVDSIDYLLELID